MKITRLFVSVFLFLASGVFVAVESAGLSGDYLITDRWRMLLSSSSPLSNPAFITDANYLSVRGALTSSFSDFVVHELGVTMPIGLYQSVGLTWLGLGSPGFEETVNSNGQIVPTGSTINSSQNYFVGTYAINPWDRLSIGLNVTLAMQGFSSSGVSTFDYGQTQQMGIGADLGLSYRVLRNPLVGNHTLGVTVQNLLPPKFSSGETYSSNLRFSWLGSYFESQIKSQIDFSLKDIMAQAADFKNANGLASKVSEWDCIGHLDFWVLRMAKIFALGGISPNTHFAGGGAGLNVPTVNAGRDLEFFYQFVTLFDGNMGSHTVYLRADMGNHREEDYAKMMAGRLNVAPNDLYNRALALYHANNYWDAILIFGRIMVEYPDFYKNDWVSYYVASCLEKMDFREKASNHFENTVSGFSRSEAVPYADLGMMRVFYRMGDYNKAEDQLSRLNRTGVPDSLKNCGYYIMGEINMQKGYPAKALQLLRQIPSTHPDYAFAQHSMAVANLTLDSTEAAIENLQECVQSMAATPQQKEIQSRSYLLLGFIFYEDARNRSMNNLGGSGYEKAVAALRMVPATSGYYEDAQLGLGWCALKSRQWNDCINAGKTLSLKSTFAANRCEGYLLQGYSYILQKDYPAAIDVLKKATELFPQCVQIPDDSVARTKNSYMATRSDYREIGESVFQCALSRQNNESNARTDSLHNVQKQMKSKIDATLLSFDNFARTQFFTRNVSKVKDDIDYALANAQRIGSNQGAVKVHKATLEKEKKIDTKIEDLQKQLKELENK